VPSTARKPAVFQSPLAPAPAYIRFLVFHTPFTAARRGRRRAVCAVLTTLVSLTAAQVAAANAIGSTALPAQWQTPTGWTLRPAGQQVVTEREPTGLTVAPDGSAVSTVSRHLR